jgi:hypothetical protein
MRKFVDPKAQRPTAWPARGTHAFKMNPLPPAVELSPVT